MNYWDVPREKYQCSNLEDGDLIQIKQMFSDASGGRCLQREIVQGPVVSRGHKH